MIPCFLTGFCLAQLNYFDLYLLRLDLKAYIFAGLTLATFLGLKINLKM